MSLLDRVQKRAESEGGQMLPPAQVPAPTPVPSPAAAPAPAAPVAPVAPVPPSSNGHEESDGGGSGWSIRHAGDEPAKASAAPAAPAPVAPAQPAAAPSLFNRTQHTAPAADGAAGDQRGGGPSSLLNRTGTRTNVGKGQGNAMYSSLRSKVHQRLVEELAGNPDSAPPDVVRSRISELVNEVVAEQSLTMTRQDKQRVVETVIHDVLGLGPLEMLLSDQTVTEIMINGPKQIYVEQKGKLTLSPTTFESNEQLMQVIDRIVSSIGRRIDESSPMVDARLKDGSRVNVIIPPLALRGPTVTIRKFAKEALTIRDLVKYGSVTESMVTFLEACVKARLNVVVSGGTGSGKTTTLNILSAFIPEDERIVTIEDAAELQLQQDHVISLETRPANVEGRGRVSIRDLVINSLRMRPDRIVIGECRGGEALDMLQAMNTGHDGSLTTLHANNAKECIGRLETLVLMAGADLPSRAIREQIGSAINIIVQQSRLRDGTRKIVSVTEVLGIKDNEVQLQEIFTFKQTGVDADTGKVMGHLTPTGTIPYFLEHLRQEGENVDESIFAPVEVEEPTPAKSAEAAAV
jgi:pilus assembly protein CpaF